MNRVVGVIRKCRMGPTLHQALCSQFHASQSFRLNDPDEPSSLYSNNPLYALVRMVAALKQKKKSANEQYVRRVLKEHIGFTDYDVDRIGNSPVEKHVFQLSVRNNIEPVVSYLKSLNITGSALVDILTAEPLIMSKPVDDQIIPIVSWLFNIVGNQAPAVLLRCPHVVVQVTPEQLVVTENVFVSAMESQDQARHVLRLLVWEYPREFSALCRMPVQQQEERVPKILNAIGIRGENASAMRLQDILSSDID